ncbi:succinyl-CoA synthetase, alpha subunit [Desulfosporosinus orientis DSM 765]|uniref:Succinyl-CoA synthetase, alpha subunit n=1 Tax=Desulfosporosinus orientis (strain ATCC 19365 / DSM 765 / NCIMB 8382 / VKM B-1628 / Singapore I) TaxID=768706 RepID=G7WEZ1_DESOD|nr:CoA-binding protein [Desulfosporosinus orientis]AET67320.1 succinyl-CoA synthetase, alpha subunit [Desulfosporosinus orientis DSM 765]
MSILLDKESRIAIQGITGREAAMVTRHSLDYGTRILAGVTPGKEGQDVHGIPVYNTLKKAVRIHDINTTVVYVPPAFVYDAVLEAISSGIRLVIIATENVPQLDAMKFLARARQANVRVIGPNSVGMITPKDRVKVGAIGGDNVERCFVPGRIGVISRSGGMTAESSWMVKRAGFGVSTSISIGGDALIGTSIKDILLLFQTDTETDAVVTFSEPGTHFEEEAAELLAGGGFTKPLFSFIAGRFTESMPEGTVFGHAGAMISGGAGKPSQKMEKLRLAGAHVLDRFDDLTILMKNILG